jgi:hypothetical protein
VSTPSSEHSLPTPALRPVYRVQAALDVPLDLGVTPQGHRRVVSFTGGHFEGPGLTGTLLPGGGADWQIIRPDGTVVVEVRYTLQTATGALLYVRSDGVRHGSPEVLARLSAGELVAPEEYTFRTAVSIETADAGLAWMNNGVFVAVGGRQPDGVVYEVYLVE